MTLGFIGLGKMGSRMVFKLLREGHEVVVWNRSSEAIENLKSQNSKLKTTSQNLKTSKTVEELVRSLEKPRIVWVMVTAGSVVQNILDELCSYVAKEDILIDGGNSYFKDTERRYEQFKNKGVKFLGIGVSGGIIAAKQGYPLMVGGDKRGYDYIIPILDSLSKPHGGHEYFGTGGAGHFVKMVHNGMEYGIMQSLGEGFGVLEKSPYDLDLLKVAKLYQKGTLLSGFMLNRAVEVFSQPSILDSIEGYIETSGEAEWTVKTAQEEKVDVEIIERSLEFRKRSQIEKEVQVSFAARMIAALRQAFGGHPVSFFNSHNLKK